MNRTPPPAAPQLTPQPNQWAVELRPPGSTRWVVVAVADSQDEAFDKLLSVAGSGCRRLRKPATQTPAPVRRAS